MSVVKPMYVYPIPYVFQEIRNVKTNSIFGYEALLRPEDGTDPKTFINARMMMGGTHQLEVDTFFNAVKMFHKLKMPGYLKINSFPNECLNVHESRVLADEYGKEFLSRIVVDILEYPFLGREAWYEKERMMLRYDMKSALNAFGDGIFRDFSSVMFYHPDVVTIPRHVFQYMTDNIQQKMYVKSLVEALKNQGTTVLAQGIENAVEYQMLADFGIDLAQGYYIGMPGIPVSPEYIGDEDEEVEEAVLDEEESAVDLLF